MDGRTYRKIMIATDGSESVKRAVETAVEFAKLSGAKLYAVYVIAFGRPLRPYPKDVGWKGSLEHFRLKASRPRLVSKTLGKLQMLKSNHNLKPANEIVNFADKVIWILLWAHSVTGIQGFSLEAWLKTW